MELLHVIATARSRGAESFAIHLAQELDAVGYSQGVVVLGSERLLDTISVASLEGVKVRGTSWVAKILALRRVLKDHRPRCVLCHGMTPLKVALLASLGMPRIMIVMKKIGMTSPWTEGRCIGLLASRIAARAADAHIALGKNQRSELVELLKVSQDKIVTIPNARRNLALPAGLVPRDAGLVIFVGALEEEKRPEVALRLISQLIEDGVDVRLRYLGDGKLRPYLEGLAATIAPGRVEFCGMVSDVWPHLAQASLLVLTSRTEGVPGAVIEAAMAGLPTVCWDVGDVTSVVKNGVTGFVVPYGDEQAIKGGIAALITTPHLWLEMSSSAREFASQFTIERVALKYQKLLRELKQASCED